MKTKIFIMCGAMLTLSSITGCYDDEGNYDYREINELQVSGIEAQYAVDVDDSLHIIPVLEGTLYSDTSRFTYEWEMAGAKVAETHDLHIQIETTPGYKYSRFIVTDKETGVKKYQEFGVNVSSSTAGDLIMVLSKYQGRAELSYLRLDKPANWAINYFENRYGTSLGNNPQQLAICYTEYAGNAPFVNAYGRVAVVADNEANLLDKSSLMLDTVTPKLTVDAYLQLVSYPRPTIENYRTEFINEGISLWRFNVYGRLQTICYFMEISAGRLFTVASMGSLSSASYHYDMQSPYGGSFSPFGFWNDMSDTPNAGSNKNLGYNVGKFILFDKNYGRFAYSNGYSVSSVAEENVQAYPGYDLIWGAATNRPNNGSIAFLSDGSTCKLLMLEDSGTLSVASEVNGGNVMNNTTSFYMMKYSDNLFFATGSSIYRYNILNINSKVQPRETDRVFNLSEAGYDSSAKITSIFVSRTEQTMLVGVSRYGNDTEGLGEPKGDLLYFDLDGSTGRLQYNAEKSYQGISGIPVDVKIKYQTHYRNGNNFDGILMDNI